MLYFLAEHFVKLEFLKSIYLRAFLGFVISFCIVLFAGRPFIKYLKVNLLSEFKFVLDVSNYKKHKEKRLMLLAKNIAKEVLKTGVEVNLDPMNSYERRIVHNTLSNFKNIVTESSGEEPNRYVVIKKRES